MKLLSRAYARLLRLMAGAAGTLMVVMMTSIVVDVVLRNLGTQSSAHLFTFNEYFLFLIPLLGAPLLVRERGHIYVEVLLMSLPTRAREAMNRVLLVASMLTCAALAWFSTDMLISDIAHNQMDSRSLDMPRWILTMFLPLSFTMMSVEFARFLVRGEDPYAHAGDGASH
ncbi:MAG: TRAP transporter small permease [Burkholderiaceae bacterium]